jgi:hypothetical protein
MCPACGNGSDDDGDGQTDYPNDTSCLSASGPSEASCPNDMDNYGSINAPTMMGDLTNAHKDLTFTCTSNTDHDASFILQVPVVLSSLTIDTMNSTITDTVLQLWTGPCTTALACNDDALGLLSQITQTNVNPGTYAITVAGYSTTHNGPFTLNVHGSIKTGQSCEVTLGGALTCEGTTTCQGTVGTRKCM